jgi:hypothetical protein
MHPTGTGKQRISTVVRLAAKEEEAPVPALELVQVAAALARDPVVAELVRDPVVAELELAQVEAVLGHGRVEAVLGHGQAVAVLELVQVEAERELVRVEAVPVPGHPRAHLALPLGTKSVTVLHRPDLPLLAAEDLAAVAETTREPAAAEAVVAWAAVE